MDPSAPTPRAGHESADALPSPWPKVPRRLPAGRGASWWSEGWRAFTAAPLPWLAIVVVLFIVNVVLGAIPVLGGVATTILGPVFAGGLLLGCHALARGRPLEFAHVVGAFQSDRLGPLAVLGLIALGVGVVLMLTVGGLVVGAAGTAVLGSMLAGHAERAMAAAMAGLSGAALLGALVAAAVGALFLLAWWFAPALVTLNRAPPVEALKASFGASLSNIGALTVFGLIGIALAVVATLPMGLGWLVLAPVGVGASYASWREVFGD